MILLGARVKSAEYFFRMASKSINVCWIKLVLCHTKTLCIVSYCKQFHSSLKLKIIDLIAVYLDRFLDPLWPTTLELFSFFICYQQKAVHETMR